MSTVILNNSHYHTDVLVSSRFLSDFMPFANGEYVKVYLYLLQCSQNRREINTEIMADLFEMTEKDICRALKYWEGKEVLKLSYEGKELTGLALLEPWYQDAISEKPQKTVETPQTSFTKEPAMQKTPDEKVYTASASTPSVFKEASAPITEMLTLSPKQRKEAEDSKDFQNFLGLVQSYKIKQIISQIDCEKLMMLFFQMDRNFDILEIITEYCAENGKKSIHYLEKLAMECHRQGLTSAKEVKQYLVRKKNGLTVMKAFGQANREPGEAEYKYIDQWFKVYGFSAELVKEACSRSLLITHEPNFQYADGILRKWREEKISTMEQVEINDSSFRAKAKLGKIVQRNSYTANRFNNFEQSSQNSDFNALAEAIQSYAPSGSKS